MARAISSQKYSSGVRAEPFSSQKFSSCFRAEPFSSQNFSSSFRAEPLSSGQIFEHARAMLERSRVFCKFHWLEVSKNQQKHKLSIIYTCSNHIRAVMWVKTQFSFFEFVKSSSIFWAEPFSSERLSSGFWAKPFSSQKFSSGFRAEPLSSGCIFEHARAMLEPAMAR